MREGKIKRPDRGVPLKTKRQVYNEFLVEHNVAEQRHQYFARHDKSEAKSFIFNVEAAINVYNDVMRDFAYICAETRGSEADKERTALEFMNENMIREQK